MLRHRDNSKWGPKMDESASIAMIFGVIIVSGLLGAAAAIWFEIRNQ